MTTKIDRRYNRGKISVEDARAIINRYWAGGITQKQLGEEYGCSTTYISYLVRGCTRHDASEAWTAYVRRKQQQ